MSLAIKVSRMQSQGGMAGQVMGGDPGLFGFLGKAIGGVAKLGGKILPGPVGTIAGTLGGILAGRKSAATSGVARVATPPIVRQQSRNGGGIRLPLPGPTSMTVRPGAALPGGRPFTTTVMDPQQGAGGPAPSGFHWNKTDYFLKDGTFVPKGTRLVKNRRRNALNPRALDRAIGRIESAKKASKRLSRVTVRKKTC